MTRTMYDSINARDIPGNPQMVAGYVNGKFQWSNEGWNLFPNAVKVGIATRSYINDGHVLDVEVGDATPAQAVDWVKIRRQAGANPSVYMALSDWAAVRNAFNNAGIDEPYYWVAHYGVKPIIPQGAVALQYADPSTSGGHYDLSVVVDYWPGVDIVTNPLTNTDVSYQDLIEEVAALITNTPGGNGPSHRTNGVKVALDSLSTKLDALSQVQLSDAQLNTLADKVVQRLGTLKGTWTT